MRDESDADLNTMSTGYPHCRFGIGGLIRCLEYTMLMLLNDLVKHYEDDIFPKPHGYSLT
jgi:hypothetical protein